jgi:hypothetical protein
MERSVSVDVASGVTSYVTRSTGGLFGEGVLRFDDIGTSLDHAIARELTIGLDDPSSAHAVVEQTYGMGRDGWRVRIATRAELSADATHFHLNGTLLAFADDTLVRERRWDERIARDHL